MKKTKYEQAKYILGKLIMHGITYCDSIGHGPILSFEVKGTTAGSFVSKIVDYRDQSVPESIVAELRSRHNKIIDTILDDQERGEITTIETYYQRRVLSNDMNVTLKAKYFNGNSVEVHDCA